MKGSLIVILFFCVGCIMGALNKFQFDTHTISMYILYALMLQVGVSIGSNKNLKTIISHLHPKMLLIPLGTIIGTLLFSALASILVSQWSVFDCMAVGSGFAYYSLSSILITQFKEPSSCPVVLPSRSDSGLSKYYSIAMACLTSGVKEP